MRYSWGSLGASYMYFKILQPAWKALRTWHSVWVFGISWSFHWNLRPLLIRFLWGANTMWVFPLSTKNWQRAHLRLNLMWIECTCAYLVTMWARSSNQSSRLWVKKRAKSEGDEGSGKVLITSPVAMWLWGNCDETNLWWNHEVIIITSRASREGFWDLKDVE